MKGPVPSIRNSGSKVTEPEVKVKRKCGRPRNPIPRHKRVSHINAEHRRRGKIQNGFQTLKNMVPKYESSGRDSKADILTKSVEHCKKMMKQCKEQEMQLKLLKAQQQMLNAEIQRHQQNLPEGKLFDDQPMTAEQRFSSLVANRTSENWRYFIFSYIMKPLFKSFQQTTDCSTKESFMNTTFDWANENLSQATLRPVATNALKNLSTETSFIDKPDLMPAEALQHCQKGSKPTSTTTSSASGSVKGHHRQSNHKQYHSSHKQSSSHKSHSSHKAHSSSKPQTKNSSSSKRPSTNTIFHPHMSPSAAKKPKGHQSSHLNNMLYETPAPAVPVKTESLPSCLLQSSAMNLPVKVENTGQQKMETVTCGTYGRPPKLSLSSVDSPVSYDSAIGLSPSESSPDSSVFGDFTGYESPLDQCVDTSGVPTSSSTCEDFLEHRHLSPMSMHNTQSMFADLETFDPPNFADTIYESCELSSTNSSSGLAYPMALPQPVHQSEQCYDNLPNLSLDSCPFLDQVDASYLLENIDQHLLNDPNDLMDLSSRSFLNDDSQNPLDHLLGEYDYNFTMSDPSLMHL